MLKKTLFILSFLMVLGPAVFAVETIQLNVGDSRPIWNDSVLNFVNTDPKVIQAERSGNQEVRIYAKYPGECYLHIWNYDRKLRSLRVQVVGKKAPAQAAGRPSDISGHYSAYFKSDRDAKYSVNEWLHTHEVLLDFPTFLGRNTTRLLYQAQLVTENDCVGQVAHFSTTFSGSRHNLILGDDVISYSELMAPGLTYQGARLQLYDIFNCVDLDVFSGDRGNIHWGKDIRDDTSPSYNVSGGKLSWRVNETLGIQGTYLMSYEEDKPSSGNRLETRALGLTYKWDRYLTLSGEAGGSKRYNEEATAGRLQGVWQDETLQLDLTVRDLTPQYETVSNWLDHQGQNGVYLSTRYRPNKYWSCWGYFDAYLQRFTEQVINTEYQTYHNRMSFALHQIPLLSPSLSLWRNYGSVSMWEGVALRLSQISVFGPLYTFYYEYSPSLYQNSSVTDSSYRQQRGIFGLSVRPWKQVELRLEEQWEYYDFRSGLQDNPRGANVILNWGSFNFPWTRIPTTFSLRYQNRQNSEETTDQSLYGGSLQLRDSFGGGLSWYLRLVGVSQHIRYYDWEVERYAYDDDKLRSEVAGGITWVF